MTSRIALGTVQFGLPYGISNSGGQVDATEAGQMLHFAHRAGADTLDTAVAYGTSETVLGEIGVGDWRVVTKLSGLPEGEADTAGWVRGEINQSLSRLRVERLAGLMLHNTTALSGPQAAEVYGALQAARDDGLVEKIGYSIYDPAELDQFFVQFPADLIQAPFNVFDQRLAQSEWLARLVDAGTEVHTRSTFLQGLLLMADADRPSKFGRWAAQFDRWSVWRTQAGMPALQAALAFVLAESRIDRVVVGATSVAELSEIFASTGLAVAGSAAELAISDEDLINPSRWGRL